MIKQLLVLLIFLNINAITAKTELTIIISYDEQSNLEDHFDSFVIDSSELTLEGCYSLGARNESRSLESLHRYCSSIIDAVQYLGTDNEFYILIQCNIEISILNHWHFIAANGVDYFVLLGDKTSYDARVLLVELILRKYSYVPQQVPEFSINHEYDNLLDHGEGQPLFIQDLVKVVYNETLFNSFKAYHLNHDNLKSLNIIFFNSFSYGNIENYFKNCLIFLFNNHRQVYNVIPIIAGLDNQVVMTSVSEIVYDTSDSVTTFSLESAYSLPFPFVLYHTENKKIMEQLFDNFNGGRNSSFYMSSLLMRYLIETTFLVSEFGSLGGKRVLEIGGGYGGMAVVVQSLYEVQSYSIVDLAICGKLQSKYISRHRAFYPYILGVIKSTDTQPVISDVLFSFFSISELSTDVIDIYMELYIKHAASGYLQLNYDDETDYTRNVIETNRLIAPLDMFHKVYTLHPCAVMLAPSWLYRPFMTVAGRGRLRIIWRHC